MDGKQSGRTGENRNFGKYSQRFCNPKHYDYLNYGRILKKRFCNGTPLRRSSTSTYIQSIHGRVDIGNTWKGRYRYNNIQNYKGAKPVETKLPSRSNSPIEGTEEYMTRKIQNTSAIIMRHLLTPTEELPNLIKSTKNPETDFSKDDQQECSKNESATLKSPSRLQDNSKKVNLHSKEIYNKIINHIGKLADGRKKNFINSDRSTHFDQVITDMQKQQRLELSRILRTMSSNSFSQSSTSDITSLMEPDFGIKIEDLPFDVIEELRHTLNIDLDQWNEDKSENSSSKEANNLNSVGPDEELVEPKIEEPETCQLSSSVAKNSRPVEVEPSQNALEDGLLESDSIHIKEELEDEFSGSTVVASNLNCSESTVIISNHASSNCNNDPLSTATVIIDHMNLLKSLETTIHETIEVNKQHKIVELKQIVEKTNLLDRCIEDLTNYRKYLTEAILTFHSDLNSSSREETTALSQGTCENGLTNAFKPPTEESESDAQVLKRRKLHESEETIIKSEPEEENDVVFFPIQDKITTMEVANGELLVGTEGGDVIFLSMKDGSILYRLDVSTSPVTCMQVLKKDPLNLYVGCLLPALRLFDFDKKTLSKIYRISDEIRCMDSMWDYVFMGGKTGYLIRYGCKKQKIEFEEQTGSEILSLKAAQEGPRCILIVGHRNAPIYVRDALSGLFLRQFSNDAVIPTVYSLVVHKSYVYCGTAKDNILVFSFHEGTLAKKIVVDKFKGISCMSINKNLLFIGCYNGSVYVYNLDSNELKSTLQSQEAGGSIVCLQILSKQVIIGKLRGGLESITLPEDLYY